MVGQILGHYKIVDKLGAGGMGEVYLAEDTTLGREVALKVLPEAFTADSERLARFEREARVLAALDHPQIAAIYSFEAAELAAAGAEASRSIHFLVMQLAEGETLAERIARGPIPVDEAICHRYCRLPKHSRRRTRRGSSTGISNPPISRSMPTATSRSSISDWPRRWIPQPAV